MRSDLHSAFRRLFRAALFLLLAGIVLAGAALFLLQIPSVARVAALQILEAVNPFEGTTVRLAGTHGTWLTSLELVGLRLDRPDGTTLFRIDTLRASYALRPFLSGEYLFDNVTLVRPAVHAVQGADSVWDLLAPFTSGEESAPADGPSAGGPGARVAVRNLRIIGLSGALQWFPSSDSLLRLVVQDLDAVVPLVQVHDGFLIRADSVRFRYTARGLPGEWTAVDAGGTVGDSALSLDRFTLRSPSSAVSARGRLPITGRMADGGAADFELTARPLAYRDLHPFTATMGSIGSVDIAVRLRGTGAPYQADARVRFSQGGTADIKGRSSGWGLKDLQDSLSIVVRALDIATVTGFPRGAADLNVDAAVTAEGPSIEEVSASASVSVLPSTLGGIGIEPSRLRARHAEGRTEFEGSVSVAGLWATFAGSGRFLDSLPSVAARGALSLPGPFPPGAEFLEGLAGGMRGEFTLSALGWTPAQATGDVAVTLAAPEASDAFLRTVRLGGGYACGNGTLRFAAMTGEGTAGARAHVAVHDSTVAVTLDSAAFEGIMLGDLLALDSVVVLNGTGRGSLLLSGGVLRNVYGHASLSGCAYGSFEVRSAEIDLRRDGSTTGVTLSASTSAGSVDARGSVTAGPGIFSGTIDRVQAAALDLASLPGAGDVSTDLNVEARGTFRCSSPDDFARLFTRAGPRSAGSALLRITGQAGPSRYRDQRITDGTIQASLAGGRWDAAASFGLEGGSATMRGSAEPYADSARWSVSELRTEGLDLRKLLGRGYPSTSLSVAMTGSAGGRTAETSSGEGKVIISPSQVNGGRLERGSIDVSLAGGKFTATADVRTGEGHLRLGGTGGPVGTSVPVTVDADVSLPDAGLFFGLDSGSATLFADVRINGTLRNGLPLDGEANLHGRGHFRSIRLDTVSFLATARNGLADVQTLRVAGTPVDLAGSGTFAFATPDTGIAVSSFRLSGSLGDARPLLEAVGVREASVRNVAFDARVTGPAELPVLRTSLTVGRGFAGEVDLVGLRGDGEVALSRWSSLSSFAGSVTMEEVASGALKLDDVGGSVSGDGSRVRFDLHAGGGRGAWGAISGEAAYGADTAAVRLDTLLLVRGTSRAALREPARVFLGRRIVVDAFDLRWAGGDVTARGTIDPLGTSSFSLRLDSVSLGALLLPSGLSRIGGVVGGMFTLDGPAHSLQAAGRLQATLTDSGRSLGTVTGELATESRSIRIAATLADTAGHPLALDALLPVRLSIAPDDSVLFVPLEGEVAAVLKAEDLDIGVLAPLLPSGQSMVLAGKLDAEATVTGARSAPALAGFLRAREGVLELPTYGIRYRGITLDLGLEGSRLNVAEARASTGDGLLTASGAITLATLTRPVFALDVRAAAFELLRTPDLTAVLDAELGLSGTPEAPVLGGSVGLREASYQLPESFGGNVSEVNLSDEDWLTLEERFGYRRPSEEGRDTTQSDLYARSSLDLDVTMARNVWLRNRRNPRMELGLEGALKVHKAAGGPLRTTGKLTPVAGRSFVEELGRRFKITGGEIQLEGDPTDAAMRIVAAYDIPAQDRSSSSAIRIGLTVSMMDRKLDLAFTSDPVMEESEIITYLVTGKPSNAALAQAGDMGSLGASFALGQVVGSAESITEGKVPLDVFQIQQDGARGVTIVAGTYVSPETYIGIRQPIALTEDTRTTTTSPNVLEFELEQQIERWLLFNLQGGIDKLLAFFRFRHTY